MVDGAELPQSVPELPVGSASAQQPLLVLATNEPAVSAPVVALEEEQGLGVCVALGAVAAGLAALSADDGYGADGQLVGPAQEAEETASFLVEPVKGNAELGT